jgi:YVTN family beta-propeller protein
MLVINGSTFQVVDKIKVGVVPSSIAVDDADHAIFVASQAAERSQYSTGEVTVIDNQTLKVTQEVPVGLQAGGIAVDPVTHTVYVSNAGSDDVSVINPVNTTGPGTIAFGSATSRVAAGAQATITVTRGGDANLESSVEYATSDGTAHAGRDCKTTKGTLHFAQGSRFETFSVPTIAAKTSAKTVSLNLKLSNVKGGSLARPYDATLTIDERTAPELSATQAPATAIGNHPYSYQFAATGDPKPTFSVGSGVLPTGLKLNPTTGVLSGEPTAGGPFTFTIKASNGVAPANTSPQITVTVSQPPTLIADTPPETWNPDIGYFFKAAGYPNPTFTYSGTMRPGLLFNGSGVNCPGPYVVGVGCAYLVGTPTKSGTYKFTVTASNGIAPNATSPMITIKVP